MSLPNSHREIHLEYGEKVNQIKNLNQKDWMKACEKLSLFVVPASGKGSHCAVFKSPDCPPQDSTCLVLTIPHKIYPNFQRDIVKKLVLYGIKSGTYTEKDLWEILNV